MPLSLGIFEKNCSNASNPPADAPIPTIGKSRLSGLLAVFDLGVFEAFKTLLSSGGGGLNELFFFFLAIFWLLKTVM